MTPIPKLIVQPRPRPDVIDNNHILLAQVAQVSLDHLREPSEDLYKGEQPIQLPPRRGRETVLCPAGTPGIKIFSMGPIP